VSEEIRGFVTGDKITVTTRVEHAANIAGIAVYYRLENNPQGHAIAFTKGATRIGSGSEQSKPLPGPYIEGEVKLENVVYPRQRPGVYHLESVSLITAGHQQIVVQEELPADSIRILPEPADPPYFERLEVAGPET